MNSETLQAMSNKMVLIRGYFLNHVTVIEKLMEMFIANYFCVTESKEIELVDWLLGDMLVSFEAKRVVFFKIIEKHYNSEFIKYKKELDALTKLQSIRNKLAHRILNLSDEAIDRFNQDRTVGLVQFADKKTPQERITWFTPDKEQEMMKDLELVHDWLENMKL
jgi:hypothetical protein